MSNSVKSERWGTYAVRDYLDSDSLIADVLLYDRIVIPVPPDEESKRRWIQRGRLLARWLSQVLRKIC